MDALLTRREKAAVIVGVVAAVLMAWGVFAPQVLADAVQQAARIGRQAFVAVTSHAVVDIDQHGAGSILNMRVDGTSKYTFDQNSATFNNPLTVTGELHAPAGITGGITITNDLNGSALLYSPDGLTKAQATANGALVTTLGGTPTAASYTLNDSAGTPVAKLRGGAGPADLYGQLNAMAGLTNFGARYIATPTTAVVVASTPYAPVREMNPISIATAGTVPLTIPSAGWYGCIKNVGTEVITIADSGNQVFTAAAALGQYDNICFDSDGTRVTERSRADN